MGNGSSRSGGNHPGRYTEAEVNSVEINRGSTNIPRPLLRFHSIKGDNVTLNDAKTIAARRPMFFCKGLAFSDRPIEIDEIVVIKIAKASTQWSGVMRFGLTNVDPACFRDLELPKFVCPDLTKKSGYWAKALSERYCTEGSVLHFYINRHGAVFYGHNGINKGLFLSDINATKPLWVVLDIYGNTVGIEFVGTIERAVSAAATALRSLSTSSDGGLSTTHDIETLSLNSTTESSSSNPPPRPALPANIREEPTTSIPTPPPRPALPVGLSNLPYSFHQKVGVNINRVNNWEVSRKDNEFDRGYCFLNRPIRIDEIIALRIEATEPLFGGALGFGLTSCNPDSISVNDLPVDADLLLERPEYWVVMKDVAVSPHLGDVLQFQLKADGRVMFSKNDAFPMPILFMDTSVDLWPFFDVFGKTKSIKLCRPREHLFRRETSLGSQNEDEFDSAVSMLPLPRQPFRLPAISFSPASSNDNSFNFETNNPDNVSRTESTDSVDEFIRQSRRNRERLLEDASNTINRVREENSAEPESITPRQSETVTPRNSGATSGYPALSTQEVLRRTEEFLSALERRSPSSDVSPTRSPNPFVFTPTTSDHINRWATSSPILTSTETMFSSPTLSSRSANDVASRPGTFEHLLRPTHSQPSSSTYLSQNQSSSMNNLVNATPRLPSVNENTPSRQQRASSQNRDTECSICLSERANAVIYRCGHVCTCMSCARTLMIQSDNCPICRQPITDVIQVFFS